MTDLNSAARMLTKQQRTWLLLTICIGAFLSHFTAGAVNVSLPYLQAVFPEDPAGIPWITTAYLLAITALLPIMGKLGDRYGHGWIHNTGYIIFAVSTALISLSSNVPSLISLRICQAIGAAMFQATNIAMISAYYPKEQRGRALGIMSSVVAIGAMTGPVAGGFIAASLSWPWLFLLPFPVAALAAVLAFRFIPAKRIQNKAISLDRVGAILFFLMIASVTYALSDGNTSGWHSSHILAALITGALSIILFIGWEARHPTPFLPISVLAAPSVAVGLITSFISFMLINSVLISMPFFLMGRSSYRPMDIGWIMTAYPLLFAVSSLISGHFSDRMAPLKLMLTGLGGIIIGLLVFAWTLPGLNTLWIVAVLALIGIGMGCLAAPNNSYIMRNVPTAHSGSIGSLIALTRNAGMLVGAVLSLGLIGDSSGQTISQHDFGVLFKTGFIIGVIGCAVLGYGFFAESRKKSKDKPLEESSC